MNKKRMNRIPVTMVMSIALALTMIATATMPGVVLADAPDDLANNLLNPGWAWQHEGHDRVGDQDYWLLSVLDNTAYTVQTSYTGGMHRARKLLVIEFDPQTGNQRQTPRLIDNFIGGDITASFTFRAHPGFWYYAHYADDQATALYAYKIRLLEEGPTMEDDRQLNGSPYNAAPTRINHEIHGYIEPSAPFSPVGLFNDNRTDIWSVHLNAGQVYRIHGVSHDFVGQFMVVQEQFPDTFVVVLDHHPDWGFFSEDTLIPIETGTYYVFVRPFVDSSTPLESGAYTWQLLELGPPPTPPTQAPTSTPTLSPTATATPTFTPTPQPGTPTATPTATAQPAPLLTLQLLAPTTQAAGDQFSLGLHLQTGGNTSANTSWYMVICDNADSPNWFAYGVPTWDESVFAFDWDWRPYPTPCFTGIDLPSKMVASATILKWPAYTMPDHSTVTFGMAALDSDGNVLSATTTRVRITP